MTCVPEKESGAIGRRKREAILFGIHFSSVEMKLSLALLPCNVDVTGECSHTPWSIIRNKTQRDKNILYMMALLLVDYKDLIGGSRFDALWLWLWLASCQKCKACVSP